MASVGVVTVSTVVGGKVSVWEHKSTVEKQPVATKESVSAREFPVSSLEIQSCELSVCYRKETWGFTSTETVKAY